MRRRDCEGGVGGLVVSHQRNGEPLMLETGTSHRDEMAVPTSGCRLHLDLSTYSPKRGSCLPCVVLHDRQRSAFATGDHAVAGFNDRCLLAGNCLNRVAQIFLMVEVDV